MAVVFMHARADEDLAGLNMRMRQRIELELPAGLLAKHPTLGPWLQKEEGAWNEVGIPFQAKVI